MDQFRAGSLSLCTLMFVLWTSVLIILMVLINLRCNTCRWRIYCRTVRSCAHTYERNWSNSCSTASDTSTIDKSSNSLEYGHLRCVQPCNEGCEIGNRHCIQCNVSIRSRQQLRGCVERQVSCFWCERLEERHAVIRFLSTHGVGWGGVGLGMMTFLAHEHIFDATENWGGVGLGMMSFLAHEHIFDATEMMSFLAHEHIFDATEMMSFLAHEHIFDATENWGGVGRGGVGDDVVPCT